MRLGSTDRLSNYEVSLLQDFLSPQYLYLPDGPTGYFGVATMRAVKAFQEDNGISQTGTIGPITRARIASLTCGRTGGTGTVCPQDAKICPDGRTVSRVGPYCEFASCQNNSTQQPPVMYSVYPSQVPIGGQVTISGSGFTVGSNEVFLNNNSLGFATLSNGGTLVFTVPQTVGTPCPARVFCIQGSRELTPGMYSLKVVNANGTSNTINLLVTSSNVGIYPNNPSNPTTPTTPTTPPTFSSSVTSGNAPLTVQFYADRNIPTCTNSLPYKVTFGDGSETRMQINGSSYTGSIWGTGGSTCAGYVTGHTYTQPGTYTATLYKTVYNTCVSSYNNSCPMWVSREEPVGTITIVVSQPQTQTQLPTISSIQSVRTGSTSVVYIGEEARVTGTNLALIFPSSGIGARLDVQIGGMNIAPYNAVGSSLSFNVPNVTPGNQAITVTNSYGVSNTYSVTVVGSSVNTPIITSFSANPPTRESRVDSVLSWVTQNTNTCSINGQGVPTTGATSTRAFASWSYTLTCAGLLGTVSQTLDVPVYVVDPVICQYGTPVNGICPGPTPTPTP
jgi:peptidoglycan hydrolase-like protein with peptidoglycan-binding domain